MIVLPHNQVGYFVAHYFPATVLAYYEAIGAIFESVRSKNAQDLFSHDYVLNPSANLTNLTLLNVGPNCTKTVNLEHYT